MIREPSPRTGQRCPVCGNAGWLDRKGDDECTHCRLIVARDASLAAVIGDIAARLARGQIDLEREPARDWTADPAGLRNIAWRFGFTLTAIDLGGNFPPDDRPARAIAQYARPQPHEIALGTMIHAGDRDHAIASLRAIGHHFARIIILIDGPHALAGAVTAAIPTAAVAVHPLNGDFAAQRNRVQAMADRGWVLQIDADERPDVLLLDSLGWLVAAADRDGLRSLGLARRNLVDGALSALYPDIQYRLNHASVRFANRVHERPVTAFAETSLALSGALDHRLDGDRVRARTRIYEAMSTGAGRREDEELLLRPFDPIASR